MQRASVIIPYHVYLFSQERQVQRNVFITFYLLLIITHELKQITNFILLITSLHLFGFIFLYSLNNLNLFKV